MYKQLTKLTMTRLLAGALTMTFVMYIIGSGLINLVIFKEATQGDFLSDIIDSSHCSCLGEYILYNKSQV